LTSPRPPGIVAVVIPEPVAEVLRGLPRLAAGLRATDRDGAPLSIERAVEMIRSAGSGAATIVAGRDPEALRAAGEARRRGVLVVTLSGGAPDHPLRRLGDVNFIVPSDDAGAVEAARAALGRAVEDGTPR
jgi:DNA-binding MurR/RpiR family transcriptional regulator